MTSAQNQVIDSNHRQITVTAGPGSGKTTTAIARIVRLIKDSGCHPELIVAITFTNAAAREIESRLSKALGSETRLGYAGTLHGFLLRLLNRQAQLVGYRNDITIIDDADKAAIIDSLKKAHRWKGTQTVLEKEIAKGPYNLDNTKEGILALDYYKTLRQQNAMDLDSILHYGHEFLTKCGTMPYEHLFVDEYQDSGELDAKIYRAMQIINKIFIGDSDQSIFGFRGANPGIMTAQMYATEGFKAVLESNFRCGKNICDAANKLIAHNGDRFPKRTISATGFDGDIYVREFDNAISEMNAIAGEINRSGQPLESFAVLTRTNAQATELGNFLDSVGIKVARRQTRQYPLGFQMLWTLLKYLSNPDSDEFALRWLAESTSKETAASIKTQAAERFTSVNEMSFKYQRNIPLGVAVSIASEAGIARESVEQMKTAIARLHNPHIASVSELCCVMQYDDFSDEKEKPGVKVCTIHKAKGLEWENVYLPGFEQGSLPLTSKGNDIQEERRLAFVAITRAKRKLFISHCKVRNVQWKGDEFRIPSQFIKEMFTEAKPV